MATPAAKTFNRDNPVCARGFGAGGVTSGTLAAFSRDTGA